MSSEHGEARNIVFHSARAAAHRSPDKRKENMTLTTTPVSLTNPRQGKLARAAEPNLVLEWQDGPATDLGFRQQKLRLSFARRHKPTPHTD